MASCAIFLASIIVAWGTLHLRVWRRYFQPYFLTVMVSVWLSQGPAIPSQAAGPMMLGSTSVSVYALISIFLFPYLWRGCGCSARVGTFNPVCVPTSTSYFEGRSRPRRGVELRESFKSEGDGN